MPAKPEPQFNASMIIVQEELIPCCDFPSCDKIKGFLKCAFCGRVCDGCRVRSAE